MSREYELAGPANSWGYRPQLDGLRTIAVYLVVAFHSGSWRLQGGFIGVDLFFVLSGFLVTNVILSDIHKSGRLRFRRFYSRRCRRLIPAAAVTIVGTAVIAVLTSNPLARASWAGDAQAASLWYANWHFIAEASDYFASDDATSPFQHFWSLSIEEQFYLVFPLILVGLWVAVRGRLSALIAGVAALFSIGLALQIYWAGVSPNRAYLGTDARGYQLLAGVLLALVLWRWTMPQIFRHLAPMVSGMALLVFLVLSLQWFDVSASNRGLAATAGAVTCVWAIQSADGGIVTRLLSAGPVRYLGQISYGTYLWHWPVVVLTVALVEIDPVALFIVSAVIGTALAALSNELIERPIRRNQQLDVKPLLAVASGVLVALVSGVLIAPRLLDSDRRPTVTPLATATPSLDDEQIAVPALDWQALQQAPPGAPACDRSDGQDCIVSDGDGGGLLLIGDSHARMYMPAFEYVAEQHGLEFSMAYSTSCPWMETSYPGGEPVGKDRCLEMRKRTYDSLIDALDPSVVVVAGFPYSLYADGLRSTRPDLAGVPTNELLDTLVEESSAKLAADGRQLVLVEPTPIFDVDPLACLSGATNTADCPLDPQFSAAEEEIYRATADASDEIYSLDLDPVVCPRLPTCDPLLGDTPVWRDKNHLTGTFSRSLGPAIDEQLVAAGIFDQPG